MCKRNCKGVYLQWIFGSCFRGTKIRDSVMMRLVWLYHKILSLILLLEYIKEKLFFNDLDGKKLLIFLVWQGINSVNYLKKAIKRIEMDIQIVLACFWCGNREMLEALKTHPIYKISSSVYFLLTQLWRVNTSLTVLNNQLLAVIPFLKLEMLQAY